LAMRIVTTGIIWLPSNWQQRSETGHCECALFRVHDITAFKYDLDASTS
jgi:hypothetical protein